MEKAILELNPPEINEHIATFHQLTCPQAKKIVASKIIDLSISHCTNATKFILDNSSILVFQYCLDDSEIELQFQDQYVHFILKNKTTIHPAQIVSIYFNYVTNTQAIPDLTTNLISNLPRSSVLTMFIWQIVQKT